MKFASAFLTVLTALNAFASSRAMDPVGIVGHTKFYNISEVKGLARTAIDLLRDRERASDGGFSAPLHPIARIEKGHVKISENFPDKKALSKGALIYMAQTGACDQATNGACLVYWKEKGLGGGILVSTQIDRSGVVYVSQSEYNSAGYRNASNANLIRQLREKLDPLDTKYAIFTNYQPY